MQGVTTAIVAFIFAGVIWPHLIKHKVQFYGGLIAVVFIILLDSVAHSFGAEKPIYVVIALLQVAAIVLLVMSAGVSARELGGEMMHTIDVVRRGGEKETIIVPLTGEQPKPRQPRGEPRIDLARDIAAEEAALDAAESGQPRQRPVPPRPSPPADTSIPLE